MQTPENFGIENFWVQMNLSDTFGCRIRGRSEIHVTSDQLFRWAAGFNNMDLKSILNYMFKTTITWGALGSQINRFDIHEEKMKKVR